MGCQQSNTIATYEDMSGEVGVVQSPFKAKAPSDGFHQSFQLHAKIGQGNFGRVYACDKRAAPAGPEPEFAVKVIDLNAFESKRDREVAVAEAESEAHLMRRMGDHTHICRLIDCAVDSRFYYMVMDNCGMSLLQALQSMPELTERTMVGVFREMFLGVASVHAAQVLHRDIKPDNFLCCGPRATVKLCDFGMAALLPANSPGFHGACGTAPFMAPEMVSGGRYGFAADVWSLGVSMYALLIGEFPYTPKKPDAMLMVEAIRCGVPEPRFAARGSGTAASPEATALLKALLCREPSERPAATMALEHTWFGLHSAGQRSGWEPGCLKKTLRSAVRQGAFTVGCGSGKLEEPDELDVALQEEQKKHRDISPASTECPTDAVTFAISVDVDDDDLEDDELLGEANSS